MSLSGRRIVLSLSIVLIPNACESRGEPSEQPFLVAPGPEAPPGWNVQELACIGSVDGPDEESSFGSIRGIELDAEGNVYVLDTQATTVRVFASDGRYLRSIGREGGGPGEFKRPTGIVLTPDGRLWVANPGNRRYDVFERDGTLAGTYRKTVRAGFMGRWDAVATEDGVIYEPHITLVDGGTEQHQVFTGFVPKSGSAELVDVVQRDAPAPPPFWPVRAGTAGGGVYEAGIVPVPFASALHDRFDSRRGYWTATTDQVRFIRRSPEGDTLLVVERAVAPRPVTDEDIDTAIRDLRARFEEGLQVDRSMVPSTMPYWEVFLVDDAGRLWVQQFEYYSGSATRPATWEIYDTNGVLLGELTLPVANNPLPIVRHNRLAGVFRDEFEVEYVVLYDLGVPMG